MTRLLLSFFIVTALLLTAAAYSAEEALQRDATPSTNKDLETYKPKTPENETPKQLQSDSEYISGDELKRKMERQSDQKEQEYWCLKGKQTRRKIERCRDEVRALKELISEFSGTESNAQGKQKTEAGKNVRKTEKNLTAAQKRLKEKERLLADLEEEAHRKNVPTGWLLCQFE